jgi:hypothetical protein
VILTALGATFSEWCFPSILKPFIVMSIANEYQSISGIAIEPSSFRMMRSSPTITAVAASHIAIEMDIHHRRFFFQSLINSFTSLYT